MEIVVKLPPKSRKSVQEWTDEDDDKLERLYEVEKKPIGEIAEIMNFGFRTLAHRLNSILIRGFDECLEQEQNGEEKRIRETGAWTAEDLATMNRMYFLEEKDFGEVVEALNRSCFSVAKQLHPDLVRGYKEAVGGEYQVVGQKRKQPEEATAPPETEVELTPEQKRAVEVFKRGENMFITGEAGCGKSFVIHHLKNTAPAHKIVQLAGTTGIVCCLLGGNCKTLHSLLGVRTFDGSKEARDKMIEESAKKFNVARALQQISVLIVDEVSMLSVNGFDALDRICRVARRCIFKAFGGIQVVFVGDFYQLAPVPTRDDPSSGKFCFEHPSWFDFVKPQNHVVLGRSKRQSDDVFLRILSEARVGALSAESIAELNKHLNKPFPPDMIVKPLLLCPLVQTAREINDEEMRKLPGKKHVFCVGREIDLSDPLTTLTARTALTLEEKMQRLAAKKQCKVQDIENAFTELQKQMNIESEIELKVDAHVMNTKNMKLGSGQLLPNGMQGKVLSVDAACVKVLFESGDIVYRQREAWESPKFKEVIITQIPLVPSWAYSIHKSQGQSLSSVEIDIGSTVFAQSQSYVALSRAKSLEGVYIKNFDPTRFRANKNVAEFYKKIN